MLNREVAGLLVSDISIMSEPVQKRVLQNHREQGTHLPDDRKSEYPSTAGPHARQKIGVTLAQLNLILNLGK